MDLVKLIRTKFAAILMASFMLTTLGMLSLMRIA